MSPQSPPPTEHPRQRRRLKAAFAVGLCLGTAWVALGEPTRADSAEEAGARVRPEPVAPRVISIQAAHDRALRDGPQKVVTAERVHRHQASWTIPAEALEPRGAVLTDGALRHPLPDGTAVTLTLDPYLQEAAEASLARYRVAQGAIVAIRPATGEILALAEHAEERPDIRDLAIQSASPAASVFKIITAAALLEHAGADPHEELCTHGGHNKLTLYHLKPDARRDRKCETFAEALGSSNNVAFARLADSRLKPSQLQATADRFLFNATIPFHRLVGISQAKIPTASRLGHARAAAGFEGTSLSPLHAAMLTAAVGNRGVMMVPHLIRSAVRDGEVLFRAEPAELQRALAPDHARTLLRMLETSVTTGTGKKFFERKGAPRLGAWRAGGKSGSLSGRNEDGQRHYSWFVALGPVDAEDGVAEIAVAALVVQGEQWTVKGAVLARELLEAEMSRRQRDASVAP